MKLPQLKTLAAIAMVLFLVSCASGSVIVTGEKRAPIEPSQVKLYLDPPAHYETIGLVEAASASGWSEQDSQNYAVEELKKQAAQIGANGVLLGAVKDRMYPGTVDMNGRAIGDSIVNKVVKGRAIFVHK
jgi:hypothetical protein